MHSWLSGRSTEVDVLTPFFTRCSMERRISSTLPWDPRNLLTGLYPRARPQAADAPFQYKMTRTGSPHNARKRSLAGLFPYIAQTYPHFTPKFRGRRIKRQKPGNRNFKACRRCSSSHSPTAKGKRPILPPCYNNCIDAWGVSSLPLSLISPTSASPPPSTSSSSLSSSISP